ncbi:PrsW family glutamic-type intramembrane protease [Pontibacter sp. G13]|uniref:PrsW family intramembrane metalloprotease n=1 Tax=Pontibacter sp. G13 TaxID=3074898 RepID=UPI0028893C08|nr:PrsW family glutamic-type intramembrane protease [Pontibacter sp. G13]WNJ20188.1 PrsW family glutamic-type intramembrane protease [Pontibacter sp. G13]
MEVVEVLGISLSPVVFIFTYVYLLDKYEREPLIYLFITFGFGVLIAWPVLYIGGELQALTGVFPAPEYPFRTLIYAFIVVALVEESMKYLVLRWYNYPHPEFDEPYDGIMYGVAVSLGFAAIENILYVYQAEGDALQTGLVRMVTAVPAHAVFGVLMGYFVGKAKFTHSKKQAYIERMKGLGIAIFFHGLYDYCLFLGNVHVAFFALFSLGLGLLLAQRAMHLHAEISPHKQSYCHPTESGSEDGPVQQD